LRNVTFAIYLTAKSAIPIAIGNAKFTKILFISQI